MGLLNLFRKPVESGGKAEMPETTTATPPAANGGTAAGASSPAFDPKALGSELLTGLKSHIAEIVKPLQDEIAALKGGKKTAATTEAEEPLTKSKMLELLKEDRQQTAAANELAGKKQTFIAGKMKDLPELYHGLLGNDPSKWPEEEQAIRTRAKADFKLLGGTAANVGGDASEGTTPAAGAVDMSKMTPLEKMAYGLTLSKPVRGK
jgi:hypothetical protein